MPNNVYVMCQMGNRSFLTLTILFFALLGAFNFFSEERPDLPTEAMNKGPSPLYSYNQLIRHGPMEASGLVWLPKRRLYLTVSDDTLKVKGQRMQWVFLFDQKGKIIYPPVIIEGGIKIADLEAVARDDKDRIYLLASQSISQKGRLPEARQAFIRGKLSGFTLMVDGSVYLRKCLRNLFDGLSSKKRMRVFGFSSRKKFEKLNLEGLSWHNGHLYIGLAGPTPKNMAIIWSIRDPDALFSHRDVTPQNFGIWRLVDTGGEGIAGLAFLDDGSMVFTTGKKGGGTLWFISVNDLGSEILKPQKVKSWDFNPEGVCPAPEAPDRMVTVVFDRGKKTPLWTKEVVR